MLEFGIGGLLHKHLDGVDHLDAGEIVHFGLVQLLVQPAEHQVLHRLGIDLGQVNRLIGIQIHVGVAVVAEFMGEGEDIFVRARGVDKEEGRLIIVQIGLKGHVGFAAVLSCLRSQSSWRSMKS